MAGAAILGKTVTTEFAFMQKSITHNPHNLAHSPGGSSSGSAAAIAAGQVELAIGTQTGGSVIRPASYCGVHALKPTRGTISLEGVLQTSQTLDQVGVFARNLNYLARLGSVVTNQPDLEDGLNRLAAAPPRILYLDGLYGARVEGYVHEGLRKIATALPTHIDIMPAPEAQVARYLETHKTIYDFEICQNIGPLMNSHESQMSAEILAAIKRGQKVAISDYEKALMERDEAALYFEGLLAGYDGLLTASATGEAPFFEEGTGDSICNCLWSLTGYPCISLPISGRFQISGPKRLGVGVQLTATTGRDRDLLGLACWLETRLG
jgi:Asp-tRNA(Asn)/Glu-tRNA(Gln) amidotransferase A subunit family amidase